MTIRVSTFELLVKPIAPRAPLPPNLRAVARRVIQGYFLTITNLQETDNIRFQLRFLSSAPTPDNLDRRLSVNNVDFIYDIAGNNLSVESIFASARKNTYLLEGSFLLPAGQTASVKLLPRLTSTLLNNPDPNFEIRGYVELSIPFQFSSFLDGQFRRPLDGPAEVLLQPEIRGTFLPNDLGTAANADFDQINYSLIPANGQALNTIEQDGLFTLAGISREVTEAVRRALESNSLPIESLSSGNQISQFAQLVATLGQIEPNEENLGQISQLLADVNIPIAMSRTGS
jgi:hypothetical protein